MEFYNLEGAFMGQNLLRVENKKLSPDGLNVLARLLNDYVDPTVIDTHPETRRALVRLLDHAKPLYAESLKQIEWEEGKLLQKFVIGSPRQAITVLCSSCGRTRAHFANGDFPYFAYIDLLQLGHQWLSHGNNVVPVLPDGRLLMVVEKRPILARYPDHPRRVELKRGGFDLGPMGSLEFPGGAINPGESFSASFLRELQEETEIEDQTALLYRRIPPIYPFGSDIALQMFYSVAYLRGFSFADKVENDGGLSVYALTTVEVQQNILNGVIASAQSALTGWNFYNEVEAFKNKPPAILLMEMQNYIAVEEVKIVRPK